MALRRSDSSGPEDRGLGAHLGMRSGTALWFVLHGQQAPGEGSQLLERELVLLIGCPERLAGASQRGLLRRELGCVQWVLLDQLLYPTCLEALCRGKIQAEQSGGKAGAALNPLSSGAPAGRKSCWLRGSRRSWAVGFEQRRGKAALRSGLLGSALAQ